MIIPALMAIPMIEVVVVDNLRPASRLQEHPLFFWVSLIPSHDLLKIEVALILDRKSACNNSFL
jgi:hypothetical protein